MRMKGKTAQAYLESATVVVDGLRGDAFITAQCVGLKDLWKEAEQTVNSLDQSDLSESYAEVTIRSGIDILIEAMKKMVFPYKQYEAKELFRQFCNEQGPLSRQRGESMVQYTSRRERCWILMLELDNMIMLSEGHRADMLLDNAGLDEKERIMVQASISNRREIDKVAEALIAQHPRIHIKEQQASRKTLGSDHKRWKAQAKAHTPIQAKDMAQLT